MKGVKGIDIPELGNRCLRFELRLLNQQTIRRKFGTDYVYEITDQMVSDKYHEFVLANIRKAQERWDIERRKKLEDMVRHCINDKGTLLNLELLLLEIADAEIKTGVPLILDVDELPDIIHQIKPFAKKQRKHEAKQRLEWICESSIPTFLGDDNDRLNELISKIC